MANKKVMSLRGESIQPFSGEDNVILVENSLTTNIKPPETRIAPKFLANVHCESDWLCNGFAGRSPTHQAAINHVTRRLPRVEYLSDD